MWSFFYYSVCFLSREKKSYLFILSFEISCSLVSQNDSVLRWQICHFIWHYSLCEHFHKKRMSKNLTKYILLHNLGVCESTYKMDFEIYICITNNFRSFLKNVDSSDEVEVEGWKGISVPFTWSTVFTFLSMREPVSHSQAVCTCEMLHACILKSKTISLSL